MSDKLKYFVDMFTKLKENKQGMVRVTVPHYIAERLENHFNNLGWKFSSRDLSHGVQITLED